MRKRERGREQKSKFYCLTGSLSQNSIIARSFFAFSTWVQGHKHLSHSLLLFLKHIAGNWVGSGAARRQLGTHTAPQAAALLAMSKLQPAVGSMLRGSVCACDHQEETDKSAARINSSSDFL